MGFGRFARHRFGGPRGKEENRRIGAQGAGERAASPVSSYHARECGASIPTGKTVLEVGKSGARIAAHNGLVGTDADAIHTRRARRTPLPAHATVLRVGPTVGEVDFADVGHLARHDLDASDGGPLSLSLDGHDECPRWEIIQFERPGGPAERRVGAALDRHPDARDRPRTGDEPPADRPCVHLSGAGVSR